ncbi:MAG: GNAT family N-acetyltransferase [Anaeroplasmataceae bacterium]
MNIRLMKIEDYKEVYNLWINTKGMGLNKTDDSEEGIKKYLARNPNTCFVAEDNNKLIGVIMSGHDGRRGFIYHVVVKEEYQKRGLGKKLVNTALEALDREGINKVALVVFSKNDNGNKFWESLGFSSRGDLIYRNKSIHEMERIDT